MPWCATFSANTWLQHTNEHRSNWYVQLQSFCLPLAAVINNITCDLDPLTATVSMWLWTVTPIKSLQSSFIHGHYLHWALLSPCSARDRGKPFRIFNIQI